MIERTVSLIRRERCIGCGGDLPPGYIAIVGRFGVGALHLICQPAHDGPGWADGVVCIIQPDTCTWCCGRLRLGTLAVHARPFSENFQHPVCWFGEDWIDLVAGPAVVLTRNLSHVR